MSGPLQPGSAPSSTQSAIADLVAMARRQDYPAARQRADALIAAGLDDARVYHVRAVAKEACNDPAAALSDFQHARTLAPRDIGILNTLALCLLRLGRNKDAIAALDEAIAIAPQFAQTYYNRGLALFADGLVQDAATAFGLAVTHNPQHHDAMARIALLAANRAAWPDARNWADRALAINPHSPNALRALAEADMADGAWQKAEKDVRLWLSRGALGPNEAHHAMGLLGDALDGQRRFDEAFDAYRAGNAAMRHAHEAKFGATSGSSIIATLHRLQETFAALPKIDAPSALPASRVAGHVFLVGFMRSGTTLLEQSLANHPDLVTMEEHEALEEATVAFLSGPAGAQALSRIDAATAHHYREAYWNAVRAHGLKPDGKVFLDKNPFNAVKLPLIATLFPGAKVIFAVRDPRTSC